MTNMRIHEDAPDEYISDVEHEDAASPDEIREDIEEVEAAETMLYDIRVLGQMLLDEELTVKEYLYRLQWLDEPWPDENVWLD